MEQCQTQTTDKQDTAQRAENDPVCVYRDKWMDAGTYINVFPQKDTRNLPMGNWMREEGKGHLLLNV